MLQKKMFEGFCLLVCLSVCFMRFGQGSHFHNVNVHGGVANGDMEAATRFPGDLAKINDNNSSDDCVDCLHCVDFSVDETAFSWKKLLSRTCITRERKRDNTFLSKVCKR